MSNRFRKRIILTVSATEEETLFVNNATAVSLSDVQVKLTESGIAIHTFTEASNAAARILYDQIQDFMYTGAYELNIAAANISDTHQKTLLGAINFPQIAFFDSRFLHINQTGHTTTLPATLSDVNDSGNANWLIPATATTLSVISSSPQDSLFIAGSGLQILFFEGLDQNLDEIVEVVLLNGTTPAVTALSFRALNTAIAVGGGTPGSGAAGIIDITSSTDASNWGRFLVNDTAAPGGRYTVPRGHQMAIGGLIFNPGREADMTITNEITPEGGFPLNFGESYLAETHLEIGGISFLPVPEGTTFKFRGFTNSGNPSQRKVGMVLEAIVASNETWASLLVQ